MKFAKCHEEKVQTTVPICHSFEKHASPTLNTPTTRIPRRAQHGQHVVPVHTDGVDTVAGAARRYPIAKILFRGRRRDGEPVVTGDEKGRGGDDRGKQHSRVEVALGRCAFAKIDCGTVLAPPRWIAPKRVSDSGSLGDLCGQWG